MHLNVLAERVKEGVEAAGLVGMRFNTIGVSDGISMGTDGMSYSLQSRDLIADSIETVMGGPVVRRLHHAPRLRQEHARLHHGHGPPQPPGADDLRRHDQAGQPRRRASSTSFRPSSATANTSPGKISDEKRQAIVRRSCPGAGACGGMYTANTMASAIEAMGMSLPYSSSTPAEDPEKLDECHRAGAAIRNLLELDLKPRDIMTRAAFENAMVLVMALGGSTNAVLHLIAMARSVDVELTIDDFQKVSERVPYLADLKPSGKYVMADLHRVGGTPAVMKYLLENGFLDGDCMTVTGKTLAENLAALPGFQAGPGRDPSARKADQVDRPPPNPPRQPGARRRRGQDHRQRRTAIQRPGPRLRFRRRHAARARAKGRSKKATS